MSDWVKVGSVEPEASTVGGRGGVTTGAAIAAAARINMMEISA